VRLRALLASAVLGAIIAPPAAHAQSPDAGVADAAPPPAAQQEHPPPRGDAGDAWGEVRIVHQAHTTNSPTANAGAGEGGDIPRIRYFLERIEVRGNTRTRAAIVKSFVPLVHGDVLDVDDPAIEAIRWRLLGTGWFGDVRLRLARGAQRGWVVLVVEVEERNTLVIENVAIGVSERVSGLTDMNPDLELYGGLAVAETNLLGTGIALSAALAASPLQWGARLRFNDPMFLGSQYGFSVAGLFANAKDFFGDDPLVAIECPPDPDPLDDEVVVCPEDVEARNAVVIYQRYGASIGTGHDLGASTRYTLDWQGEVVDVDVRPDAASERRGDEVVPIDFSIDNGVSFVSSVQLGLVYDRRDDPALPSRGVLIQFRGDLGSGLIGSDYDFLRLQTLIRLWTPLPWGHVLRWSGFAGVVFGRAPFFYKFYVSDLSDLIPSRVLELNFDRRAPPDVFGTSIAEMRSEELAGRLDVEYEFPLHRGGSAIRAVDAFVNVGLYALADRRDVGVAIPGYQGLSRIPVDLTFDLGVRADTDVGVFQLGLSSLLGFVTW